jgi:hypothetical protein
MIRACWASFVRSGAMRHHEESGSPHAQVAGRGELHQAGDLDGSSAMIDASHHQDRRCLEHIMAKFMNSDIDTRPAFERRWLRCVRRPDLRQVMCRGARA